MRFGPFIVAETGQIPRLCDAWPFVTVLRKLLGICIRCRRLRSVAIVDSWFNVCREQASNGHVTVTEASRYERFQ